LVQNTRIRKEAINYLKASVYTSSHAGKKKTNMTIQKCLQASITFSSLQILILILQLCTSGRKEFEPGSNFWYIFAQYLTKWIPNPWFWLGRSSAL